MRHFTALSLLFLSISISACGFTPLYGDQNSKASSSAENNLNNIEIALIPNREGQFLRNALVDRFYINGEPASAKYLLKIDEILESVYDFDVTIDSEATRRQLKLRTEMTLLDIETKKSVLKRDLTSIVSHNVLESEFSTLVTEQNARDNALNDLARQVERQLSVYFTK